jgi:hypothetical protein
MFWVNICAKNIMVFFTPLFNLKSEVHRGEKPSQKPTVLMMIQLQTT